MKRSTFKPRKVSLRDAYIAKIRKEGKKTIFDRNGKPMQRKPIKKQAKARRTEQQKYFASFAEWAARPENARCAICVVLVAAGEQGVVMRTTERHHFRGRHGKLLNWEPGWVPCCRGHREWVHDPRNRVRAEENGLISTRAEWNTYPAELRYGTK